MVCMMQFSTHRDQNAALKKEITIKPEVLKKKLKILSSVTLKQNLGGGRERYEINTIVIL